MGFSITKPQALLAPPYFTGAIVMYITAVISDKYRIRGPIVLFNAVLGLIGFLLLGYAHNNALRYFGAFFATITCTASIAGVVTFQVNNIRGQWKTAFSSATLVAAGGMGDVVGSTIFRVQDAPMYGPGIMATIVANRLIIVITLGLMGHFWRVNRTGGWIEGLEGFRYTL